MVLCGTWSETSVAQSQLTQFWQIPRHRTLLFHCERHFSSRLPPSGGTWKYAKAPSTKKTWRDSLPVDMLLSAVSVLVVSQSSSEIPEGLMNNPVFIIRRFSRWWLSMINGCFYNCCANLSFAAWESDWRYLHFVTNGKTKYFLGTIFSQSC